MLKAVLYTFSILLIATVVLPLLKKDYWLFRVFDYPRLQKFGLILMLCLGWTSVPNSADWFGFATVGILFICLIHLAFLIYPFTLFGKKMIDKASNTRNLPTLNLLVSNVYQENQKYRQLLQLIEHRKPDIVFLLETNQLWLEKVKKLRDDFPYCIEVPKENTYGLLFYSKYPIKDYQINYLIDNEIPSISASVTFANQTVKIFGLHPTPPVPHENEYSTDRDAEILMIGKMAEKEQGPCLVIGDLNDVAWSYTTELFLKTSGLLDPRRGRGLYSTFHANYTFLRWPLDHFFVSGHFRLVNMKVERNIGSDHFPISIGLIIADENDENALNADTEDKKFADEKIEAALNDDPM